MAQNPGVDRRAFLTALAMGGSALFPTSITKSTYIPPAPEEHQPSPPKNQPSHPKEGTHEELALEMLTGNEERLLIRSARGEGAITTYRGAGRLPEYMLHGFTRRNDQRSRFVTTEEDLWNGLERLYERGFRTVPRSAYLEGKMIATLQPEERPLLLSADDGKESLLRFKKEGLSHDCLLDALQQFATSHPGFGTNITCYLDFREGVTMGGVEMRKKLCYLAATPTIEIGYHTMRHENMSHRTATWVREDVAAWDAHFERLSGLSARAHVQTAAWPGGAWPRDEGAMEVIRERFTSAVDAYGGLTGSKNHPSFSRYRQKRIEFHARPEFGQPDTVRWAEKARELYHIEESNMTGELHQAVPERIAPQAYIAAW